MEGFEVDSSKQSLKLIYSLNASQMPFSFVNVVWVPKWFLKVLFCVCDEKCHCV
jgi:hypothetical protein